MTGMNGVTGMTSSSRTRRLPLILSIAGTIALTALLAVGPTYDEALALTLATTGDDAVGQGPRAYDAPASGGQTAQATWTAETLPAGNGEDVRGTVLVHHVWYASRDFQGIAPEDGSLSEWAPHYFVAHSFGTFGQAMLGLAVGDAIVVNGSLVVVEGAVTAPKYTAYDQIMDAVGWDATVFQTCIPDTESCLFVYARGASSTLEAADEARAFAGLPPIEAYGADEADGTAIEAAGKTGSDDIAYASTVDDASDGGAGATGPATHARPDSGSRRPRPGSRQPPRPAGPAA